jgi:two-component system chemotaxis response regulator CheB
VTAPGPAPDPFPVTLPVVALVGSTGGLAALQHVLEPLPADLPAAVLIALHQDPHGPGRLAEILDRSTDLAVVTAQDGDELRPGRVLVVPPGRHLLVTAQGRVALIPTGRLPPARPSADLMLATLAVVCGPGALAVVLTGGGHDAEVGTRAVVRCGGTVLAQDEATSEVFSMPSASIETELVSQVLPVEAIAAAVVAQVLRLHRQEKHIT